ncbi:MAG: 2-oxoacid:ferredoxin oxidoreductase subunit beta, partial [Halobacteriales archaeon]
HDGFGFVNVFSPCVTFNDVDTYDYYRDNLVDLEQAGHDPTDYDAAKEAILDADKEYQGVFYRDEDADSYGEAHDLAGERVEIGDGAPEGAMDLVREFY